MWGLCLFDKKIEYYSIFKKLEAMAILNLKNPTITYTQNKKFATHISITPTQDSGKYILNIFCYHYTIKRPLPLACISIVMGKNIDWQNGIKIHQKNFIYFSINFKNKKGEQDYYIESFEKRMTFITKHIYNKISAF